MSQVVEVVEPQRERMDAILVFPSMPAVMRLNKLGTFNLAQLGMSQKKSPIGEFMKGMRKSNDRFEETMLKLVRTLPNVLKYLPSDKAQDAKNFIQVRAAGSPDTAVVSKTCLMLLQMYLHMLIYIEHAFLTVAWGANNLVMRGFICLDVVQSARHAVDELSLHRALLLGRDLVLPSNIHICTAPGKA